MFPPPGIARQDWKIVRALGEFIGVTLPYSDDEEMEERVQTLVPLTLNMDELSHSQVHGVGEGVESGGDIMPACWRARFRLARAVGFWFCQVCCLCCSIPCLRKPCPPHLRL